MMDLHNVFIPLLLSCTSVFTVLYGQKVVTDPKVTVYQGNDVTLLCQYIHRSSEDKITQVQWTWQNQSSEYKIMVFNNDYGLHIHETPLKDRVSFSKSSPSIDEASIIIRDVKISDQGLYSCDITIFPGGSLTGQTTLIVLEDSRPVLSTAEAVGIGTAVVIITLIIVVVGYLFLQNRRRTGRTFTYYTTQSPSDLQQDVTYSDVTILKSGKANRSTSTSGDIEYAAVSFSGRSESASLRASASQMALGSHTAEQDTVYAQVKRD
ncbi:nectin-4-like isoform X2 [Carassius auratus]|uniref:Nectin-4-like isoform X2 n=2 Tax=Carassius TaxID=7956 RepID=A0A6P6R6A8_CARAU|nr:nectin-4-like isoform X2 [Carassius auratus]XP_052434741.1 nectin-4-like isoform X1 [Carassius gibelio]